MSNLNPVIYILAFAAVVIVVQTLSSVFLQKADRAHRINRRLAMIDDGKSREDILSALLNRSPGGAKQSSPFAAMRQRLELRLLRAGLSLSVVQVAGLVAAIATILWFIGLAFATWQGEQNLILNIVLSFVGALVLAAVVVMAWISSRCVRRLKKIEEQLPVGLDIINRAIKAGHPVIAAIQLASNELGDPLGSEFGLIVDETTYGVEFQRALDNFAARTGSQDVGFFAVSVGVQASTGGNLVEILQGLATVMRERQMLAKRVKSLASEGRMSAIVLSVLPVAVVGTQLFTHPRFYSDKFSDPVFWPVIAVTLVVYLSGWLMLRRIVNFKY